MDIKIEQFTIIQAFTALWENKDKETKQIDIEKPFNFIKRNRIEITFIFKINKKVVFWSEFCVNLKWLNLYS